MRKSISISRSPNRVVRRRTNDAVSHILLGALALCGEQRRDRLTREVAANLTGAGGTKLLDDRRVLLTEAAGMEEDGTVVALGPADASVGGHGKREESKGAKSGERLAEHVDGKIQMSEEIGRLVKVN